MDQEQTDRSFWESIRKYYSTDSAIHSFLADSRGGLGIWELRNKSEFEVSLRMICPPSFISHLDLNQKVSRDGKLARIIFSLTWPKCSPLFHTGKTQTSVTASVISKTLPVISRSTSNSVLWDFSKKTQEISHPILVKLRLGVPDQKIVVQK